MFSPERLIQPQERNLPLPGIVGRAGRFILGLFSLWFVSEALRNSQFFVQSPPFARSLLYLLGVAIAFWVLPDVVKLGFNIRWGRRSQQLFLGLALVAIVLDLVFYASYWGPPLGWVILAMAVFTHSYLGISHVLAAILGTPGCEMRAIPHLFAILRGESTQAVVCPGHWDTVDRWEANTS